MLDRADAHLSVRRQCTLPGLARSGVYRRPPAVSEDDLALMRRIDELFMAWPRRRSRRLAAMLRAEGRTVNRKRVQRLMRRMGIAAPGPKPRTSKPAPGHAIFPYLLRGMAIGRPNQVWAADITYIPNLYPDRPRSPSDSNRWRLDGSLLYLVAIMDWASRAVLASRLSNRSPLPRH